MTICSCGLRAGFFATSADGCGGKRFLKVGSSTIGSNSGKCPLTNVLREIHFLFTALIC